MSDDLGAGGKLIVITVSSSVDDLYARHHRLLLPTVLVHPSLETQICCQRSEGSMIVFDGSDGDTVDTIVITVS